ncbi:MAG: phosphate signaling complex protein PhoU [Gammaproteobacteria bacterium]|nr:phosphate signaling complex protein PhoU [Gammaproteobacteria bacterium]
MNNQVEGHSHHISHQFNVELEDVKTHMLEMGGMVEKQLSDALESIIQLDSEVAQRVRKDDTEIDKTEMVIDGECSRILARRQPAASDLRLILSIVKTIRDLERIGDESSKIAKMAIRLSEEGGLGKGFTGIRQIGDRVGKMVHSALDAFARYDVKTARKVMEEDEDVDIDYGIATGEMIRLMMEEPSNISSVLNIVWAVRALERIGDHAKNISEHVLYLVEGTDVRHGGLV